MIRNFPWRVLVIATLASCNTLQRKPLTNTPREEPASSPASSKKISAETETELCPSDASKVLSKSNICAVPLAETPQVSEWVRYFKSSRNKTFRHWEERGAPYKASVQKILRREGVPSELYYLALVESGFNNHARSPRQAAGPWQFVAGTATLYGLKINKWVDERRDPIKSTQAAAAYFKKLYEKFGNWPLVFAAYNAGPGNIQKAVERGGSSDFWQLCKTKHLKQETKDFVPRVLAAMIVGDQQEALARNTAQRATPYPGATVAVKSSVKIADVADQLGMTAAQIRDWNPELSHGVTPPQNYLLRLPADHNLDVNRLVPAKEVAAEPVEKRERRSKHRKTRPVKAQTPVGTIAQHRVGPGETLTSIAHSYGLTVPQLRQLNPAIDAKQLKVGRVLTVNKRA